MRLGHALAAAVVVLAVAVHAPAAPKLKKHHLHAVHGVVEAVHKDNGKATGVLVIRVHHHHHAHAPKPPQPPAGAAVLAPHPHHHVTVHATIETRFEKVMHMAKGVNKREPASFRDLHKGEHVVVIVRDNKPHHARAVDILVGHHAQKPKPAAGAAVQRKRKKARALERQGLPPPKWSCAAAPVTL